SLAYRNLKRGQSMGLPSGQTVARYMGEKVIADSKLRIGPATREAKRDKEDNPLLVDVSPNFKDNAPLWFYILAEAQQAFVTDKTPIRLGPVGGRIVAEVFIGLLLGDQHSFISQYPGWKPNLGRRGKFDIADLISQARLAKD